MAVERKPGRTGAVDMATALGNQVRSLKVVMLALEGMRRSGDCQEIDGMISLLGNSTEALEDIEDNLCKACGVSEVKELRRV